MLRLVAIAALTIPLFFLLLTLLSRVGLSDDHAAVAAMVTAFVLAPMAFLKLWRPATPDRPNGLPPESLYVVTLYASGQVTLTPSAELASLLKKRPTSDAAAALRCGWLDASATARAHP